MKNLPILALLALNAPIIARAQTAATSDVPAVAALPMAPKSAETSDAFVWRFAPPVGSRWTMRSFTRINVEQKIPSMQGEPAHNIKIGGFTNLIADYDVINRDQFGASTIRITYRQMTGDDKVTVDGKLVESTPTKDRIYKGLNGVSYTIKQASDGKVWGIDGLNAAQSKILNSTPGLDAASRAALAKINSSLLSEESLRKMMNVASDAWPNYPVRAGESWNYAIEMPADFPMQLEIESKRTLKSLDPKIASIAEAATYDKGSLQLDLPSGAPGQSMKIDMENLRGTVSGYSNVQRSSGIALQTLTSQTMTGTLQIKLPDPAGGAPINARVPIKASVNTNIVMEPRA